MASKTSKYEISYNLAAEFVDDASGFKIVPKFRDPKSPPTKGNGSKGASASPRKKPRKKKDK